jgi:KipI family sensor histidine kinase inhibitor
VLVEVGTPAEVEAVRTALTGLTGVVELVPGARTVLVAVTPGSGALSEVTSFLRNVDLSARPARRGREIVLPVCYDGPDLELVARTAGISAAEVTALHSGAEYTVAFCGFAPGFGYLTGLPAELRQPRLENPRTSVPAGSVGVAGEFTGAYPRSSPGGWRLLGRTSAVLFDARRDPPSLLRPGDRVRFEVTPT